MVDLLIYQISPILLNDFYSLWEIDKISLQRYIKKHNLTPPKFMYESSSDLYPFEKVIDYTNFLIEKIEKYNREFSEAEILEIYNECKVEISKLGFDVPEIDLQIIPHHKYERVCEEYIESRKKIYSKKGIPLEEIEKQLSSIKFHETFTMPSHQTIYICKNPPNGWNPIFLRYALQEQLLHAIIRYERGEWNPQYWERLFENPPDYLWSYHVALFNWTKEAIPLIIREKNLKNLDLIPYLLRSKIYMFGKTLAMRASMESIIEIILAGQVFSTSSFWSVYNGINSLMEYLPWEILCLADVINSFPPTTVTMELFKRDLNYERKKEKIDEALKKSGLCYETRFLSVE